MLNFGKRECIFGSEFGGSLGVVVCLVGGRGGGGGSSGGDVVDVAKIDCGSAVG